jgi:hypothetical protein
MSASWRVVLMERASRWLAIWHIAVFVAIHAVWALVWNRTGADPSEHESWRVPPLSAYPTERVNEFETPSWQVY